MKPLVAPTRQPIRCTPVRPNVGVTIAHQRRIDRLISQMARAVSAAVLACYKANPPRMATDEATPAAMRAVIAKMSREWGRKFDEFGARYGRKFAGESAGSADRSFATSLREAGFTVKFQRTRAVNEVIQAETAGQVALIKSIPQQYLAQVEGSVMRSVEVGHNMHMLAKELEERFGVTRRRAAFIARDQNSKMVSSIARARQIEAGLTHATWLHSAAGRVPRPEHVAASGKRYEVAKGMFLEGVWTWPGREINCRCVSIPVIPGLDD